MERVEGEVSALWQLVMLDHPEQPRNIIQFRAVGGQVVEVQALLAQRRPRGLDRLPPVEAGVVQHHHGRLVRCP
jgi:hypothetical protein